MSYTPMYSSRMNIGDRLDWAIKDRKIKSQSALARASGVPQATISRILKGNGKVGPETETIKKLATALQLSFEWLNEGTGEPYRVRSTVDQTADLYLLESAISSFTEDIATLFSAYRDGNSDQRRTLIVTAKAIAKRIALDRAKTADN